MEKVIPINNQRPELQPTNQIKIDLTQLELVALPYGKCLGCGNETFEQVMKYKVMSAMHPKNSLGKPMKIYGQAVVCTKCNQEDKSK